MILSARGRRPKLLSYLDRDGSPPVSSTELPLIGVLPGCGVGPEVISAALRVLRAVEAALDFEIKIEWGGPIGEEAEALADQALPENVVQFCTGIFERGGCILNGPGGGRYVYDLRRRFNLFCKFVPVRTYEPLGDYLQIGGRSVRDVDMLIVRDNLGGVYQGTWREQKTASGRQVEHSFVYSENQVKLLMGVAARAAADRRGKLHIIAKEGGVPGVTALWRELGFDAARCRGVKAEFMNIDVAAYEIIRNPGRFDVVVAPNLFGDILSDIAGLLTGSRAAAFSASYDAEGHGVYQTNHGCGHDLAGTDRANPAGQILSLAMLLRESLGLDCAAALIEAGVCAAWQEGWRTADLEESSAQLIGTRQMAERIAEQVLRLAGAAQVA